MIAIGEIYLESVKKEIERLKSLPQNEEVIQKIKTLEKTFEEIVNFNQRKV